MITAHDWTTATEIDRAIRDRWPFPSPLSNLGEDDLVAAFEQAVPGTVECRFGCVARHGGPR